MQEISIREAAPQIFRRPLLYVGPDEDLVHAATFLAIGPQIYADGLVVLDAGGLVGTIGGRNLVRHILEKKEKWLDAKAGAITERLDKSLDAAAPVRDALDMFAKTHFAFAPVSVDGLVVASLSVRDLLGSADAGRRAGELASQLKTVSEDKGVLESMRFMVENDVRDLVAMRNDGPYVINDRKVLEFLLGHEARQLAAEKGFSELDRVPLSHIGFSKCASIGATETAGAAAKMLSDASVPCLFVDGKILTP